MIVALGKGETDEYKDNLHKVGIICFCKFKRFVLVLILL